MFWEDHGRPTLVWLYRMTGPILSLLPAVILGLWARHRLRSARREAESPGPTAGPGVTGALVASAILEAGRVEGVAIVPASGPLADFYDAARRELRLSAEVFEGRSPWATAVAAHEAGHALQGRVVPGMCKALILASRFAAIAGWMAFAAGFAIDFPGLAADGVLALTVAAAVALALVPIGLDANRRALGSGALGGVESDPAFAQALRAAPLAHVASLLPLGVGRSSGRRDDRATPA